jgi:hypothetical protein
MDAFHPGLWERLELVPTLANSGGLDVVDYLLELACQPQNTMNIDLGRRALVGLPREWLLSCIEERAAARLSLNEEWEYRRYLEACCFIDTQLAERVAALGLGSDAADVREAAREFAGTCAEFKATNADWLR